MTEPARLSPILFGAALLGAGLVLHRVDSRTLSLPQTPERPDRLHTDKGLARAARKTRDGLARVMPSNLTTSLGRTLVIAGAGLVLVRLLDLAVDEGEELF